MTNKPLVSIIIPTYNRVKKVSGAIESALNQTYSNIQITVVDDGSDDNTSELMKNYPTVEYIIQEHAGQATARNRGLKNSKGSIIASLDSDDAWNPDFLEKMVEKMENDDLDFVFSNWNQGTHRGEYEDSFTNYKFMQPILNANREKTWITLSYEELRKLYLKNCPSPSSSLLIRKSSMVSSWDEKLNIADDWCLLLDIVMSKPRKVAFTQERLWRKDIDGSNIFDGRDGVEVMKLLYIEDINFILNRYADRLTSKEREGLEHKLVENLVVLAKHRLVRDKDWSEAVDLVRKAARINLSFAITVIPRIMIKNYKLKKARKLKALSAKVNTVN